MKLQKGFAIPMLVLTVLALFAATYATYADSRDKLIPYKQIATVTVPSGLVFPGGGSILLGPIPVLIGSISPTAEIRKPIRRCRPALM
jgi:uncharacterized membrane protein